MNRRSFVILIAVGLALIVGSNFPLIAPDATTPDDSGLRVRVSPSVVADEPNGTLVVDGVTVMYEEDEILQMGSIVVTNGGRMILNNTDFVFSQLAPHQYRVTVDKSSELRLESSSFITKYPVSWDIDSSNVTLIDSSAVQCFLRAEGHSVLSMSESHVSGVTLTDHCETTASGSGLGKTSISSFAVVTLSNTEATSVHLSDSAYLEADALACTQIIASDDSSCALTQPECNQLHLWEQSEASVSGGSVLDIGLYDTTSIAVSDCSVGYFVIRSSLTQTLDSLSIDELLCIHYSEVHISNCDVGTLTATNHANLSITSCNLGDVLLTEWCSGEMSDTNVSSAIVTMYATWTLTGTDAEYFECSREALIQVFDSTFGTLYAWSFNLTTWSYANVLRITRSSIHLLSAGWWTMPELENCTIYDASLYHHLIFNMTHTNFTNTLLCSDDVTGSFSFCSAARLYIRSIANVTMHSSSFAWLVEPGFDTHSITGLPLGGLTYWNSHTNGTFDAVSFNLTIIDSTITDLKIIVGRGVTCSIFSSSFSSADVMDTGTGEFTGCNISQFIGNGDVTIRQSNIETMTAGYISVGYLEDCNIDTLNIFGTTDYTAIGCTFSHAQVGGWDGAVIYLEGCNSTSFWASGTGTAELQGCYIWQIRTYNYIHIAATDCVIDIWYNGYVDYPTASATNCTLGTITAIAHTTLTMVDCDVEYFGTGNYASTSAENCTFCQFSATNWAQVTLEGDFSWTQSFTVSNDAVVYRVFSIHTAFSNGTSCPMTDYVVLSATNVTLRAGTTSVLGEDQFTLSFIHGNMAEFDDQYAISVDTVLLEGWHQFNVSSSQPMQILVAEKPGPPQPEAHSDLGEAEDATTIVGAVGEGESPVECEDEPVLTEETGSLIVLGFVACSGICVSAVIIVQHPPTFRTASFRRRTHEET